MERSGLYIVAYVAVIVVQDRSDQSLKPKAADLRDYTSVGLDNGTIGISGSQGVGKFN